LGYWTKATYGIGRANAKNKYSSFSITYNILSTMFPQLWINETKRKRGKILRIKFTDIILTSFLKKYKYYFNLIAIQTLDSRLPKNLFDKQVRL